MLGDVFSNGKYLITCSDWFYTMDGGSYKGIWGDCEVVETKDIIGIGPKRETNWMVKVGVKNPVFIGGCQINYFQKCDEKPIGNNYVYMPE